jgi:hypothetical protein
MIRLPPPKQFDRLHHVTAQEGGFLIYGSHPDVQGRTRRILFFNKIHTLRIFAAIHTRYGARSSSHIDSCKWPWQRRGQHSGQSGISISRTKILGLLSPSGCWARDAGDPPKWTRPPSPSGILHGMLILSPEATRDASQIGPDRATHGGASRQIMPGQHHHALPVQPWDLPRPDARPPCDWFVPAPQEPEVYPRIVRRCDDSQHAYHTLTGTLLWLW